MEEKRALFIGAHNDENEYGSGGLAYLLFQKGFKVYFLNVACKRRVYKRYTSEEEKYKAYNDMKESQKFNSQDYEAARILGAEKTIIGESDDSFYECNNRNIYLIKEKVDEIKPDITFIHWPQDNHPDHAQVSKASFQALCYAAPCEVYAFEAGHYQSMVYFYPDFFVNIAQCMDKVYESLMAFDQPTASGKSLCNAKEVCARFRGDMAGFIYAEAYKIIRFPSDSPELILPKLLREDFKWGGSNQYPWGSQYFQAR